MDEENNTLLPLYCYDSPDEIVNPDELLLLRAPRKKFTPYSKRDVGNNVARRLEFRGDGGAASSGDGERFELLHLHAEPDSAGLDAAAGPANVPAPLCEEDNTECSQDCILPLYCGGAEEDGTPVRKVFEGSAFDRRASPIHTVHRIPAGFPHPGDGVLEKLGTNKRSRGGGCLIFLHAERRGNHYHIIHGCSLAGGRCQCFKAGGWLHGFGFPVGKPIRYSSQQFDDAHFFNIWV